MSRLLGELIARLAGGAKTTTTTDVLGRTSSKVIGPDTAHIADPSQTTTYAYSTLTAAAKVGFQQVTVTDSEGKSTVFESNLAGQRTAMVDPNAGATSYVYDGNGQSTSVTSAAGTITMGYDVLGRMVSRDTGGSSSATWDYVKPVDLERSNSPEPAQDLGLLRKSTSRTHTSLGDLTTTTSATYDAWHRPVSSKTELPTSPPLYPDLLGDLSGTSYETKMVDATGAEGTGYDAIGQATNVTLPAMGALSAETVSTGYSKSGSAQTLTLTSAGKVTALVTGVTFSGTGQMLSRTYGNGLTRAYGWDAATRALTGLSASFVTNESGSAQTAFVQKDSFTRDVMGRMTTSTNEVPVLDGTAANGKVTAECFTYDGFNRLSGAWTVADAATATCGTAAPANATATGWDASTTAYAAQWSYSTGGRITSLVKGATGAPTTSTYAYTDTAHPAAVTSVAGGTTTDSFGYDAAGRMISRTVDGVTTALTWDVTSSLVESNGQGGRVVYAYDASGQRVAQARVADANGVGTATGYVASGQVGDPDTAATSTGDVSATRYYTFAGSTVAIRTNDNKLALMLGDEQGSTNVVMPVTVTAGGALASATLADARAVTRTSYTPYGQLRGADNSATDRGWLGQVEDRVDGATGTGLTYLNARYYDPATSRFISPDPLMDPGDPKTLDPYRYADNNPVVFTDASGLKPLDQYDCAEGGTYRPTNKGTVLSTGGNGSGGGSGSGQPPPLTPQQKDRINFGDQNSCERVGLCPNDAGIKDLLVPKFIVGLQGYDQLYGEQNHGHVVLDLAGFAPGVGAAPDLVNAGWYCLERSWLDCAVSAGSTIPIVGDYLGYLYTSVVLAPVYKDAESNGTLVAPIGDLLRKAPVSTSLGSFPAYGASGGLKTRFDGAGLLAGYAAYDANGQLLLTVSIDARDDQYRATEVSVQTYGMTDGLLHPHGGVKVLPMVELLPSGNH